MKITNRIHHGPKCQSLKPYSVRPEDDCGVGFMKPAGLWYSVHGIDDKGEPFWTWEDWCEENQPNWLDRDTWKLNIKINKILKIRTKDCFDLFFRSYGIERMKQFNSRSPSFLFKGIDWKKVGERYSGIEIAPYLESCRAYGAVTWYDGWDCASGVIWDMDALKDIQRIKDVPGDRATKQIACNQQKNGQGYL